MEKSRKNILVKSLVNFFKGIIFGVTNIIPGVSGGTIAVIMGIYEDMIFSLNNIFKGKKQFIASMIFLLPIALGAVVGIFAFASLLAYCLEYFSLPTNMFFAGLVLGSIPHLIHIIYPGAKTLFNKKGDGAGTPAGAPLSSAIKGGKAGFKIWHPIPFLIAAAAVIVMAFFTPAERTVESMDFWQYAFLPVAGFISAVAMIIPGVSGSFMLKLIGWYGILVTAVAGIFSGWGNILILGLFALGVILGVLAAAKIIAFLFKRFKTVSYLVILGLVAGCIPAIFIQNDTYVSGTGVWGIVTGAALLLIGAATAVFFGYYTERSEAKAGKEKNAEGSAEMGTESISAPAGTENGDGVR